MNGLLRVIAGSRGWLRALSQPPWLSMFLTGISMLALSAYAQSVGTAGTGEIGRIQDAMKGIEAMRRLPVSGMQLVQAGGVTFLMSDNGRFVVMQGKMYDLWHNEEIKSVADLDRLAARLDLNRMKLDINDLATVSFGKGSKLVTVFVDPYCEHCQTILAQAAGLGSTYTFRAVLLPLLGDRSVETTKQLLCSDKAKAAVALVKHTFVGLSPAANECALSRLQKTVITAKILGIDSVPFVVSHDGRVMRGASDDLATFLSKN